MKKLKADKMFLKRQSERKFRHEVKRKRKRQLLRAQARKSKEETEGEK